MRIKRWICRFFLGTAVSLVIAENGFADTDVSGPYFSDTTWSVQESPYIVKGDVQIPSGVTLTIQPGVTIKYSGAYQILVKGTIIANGTAGSWITFTSSTPNTSSEATIVKFEGTDLSKSQLNYIKMEYASKSIRVGEESEHNQKPKNSGTLTISNVEITNAEILTDGYETTAKLVLNNATINKTTVRGEYPRSESIEIIDSKVSDSTINSESYNYGITIVNSYVSNTNFLMGCCDANIKLENSIISSCTFKDGGGSPVNGPLEITRCLLLNGSVNFPSAKSTISNSIFAYDNSFTNTDCLKIGNGTLKYLSFIGNGIATGLVITGFAGDSSNGSCDITYSVISKNATGISLSGGTGSFSLGNSNITGNSNYNLKNNKTIDVTASYNYWDTTTTSEIEAMIFDYYDNINYGKVTYNPYLTSLDINAPISPPAGLTTTAGTSQITLSWSANSESDTKGYKVYYGTSSTGYSYTNSVDVGNTSNYTITGLSTGKYYVTVTAYDTNYYSSGDDTSTIINENQTNGNESWYAGEKTVTISSSTSTPTPTPTPSDTTAPSGSISINSGASYTNSSTVTLARSATDSTGVTGYYLSDSSSTPSASASGWTSVTATTSYSATVSYSLSGGEGSKTIYAWYKDAAGNVSSTANASITLDTTAPTVTITSPTSNATYTSVNSTISLGGSALDSTSGVSSVTWSNSSGGSGTASGTTSWSVSSVSLTSGSNAITVTATDNAGNTAADSITVTYSAAGAPTVTTGAAGYVTSHFAMLSGTVNPNNASTTVWYEYGTKSGSYGNNTFTQTVTGSSTTTVNTHVSGLSADTTYYYRIAAENSAVTSYGSEKLFTTSKLMDVKTGKRYSLALKSDETVWAWGWNYSGQLGDGTTTDRTTPVQASGLSGVTAIAGGYQHTIALKTDGTVWAWGDNSNGQLGDGTITDSTSPVQVSGLSSVVAVAVGWAHSFAVRLDGTVWAWGYNGDGQLGDGTTTERHTPVQVTGLSGVTAIARGADHTIALKSDGTVWAWGRNYYGQLGDGTTTDRTTPVQVTSLSGVTAIACGAYHTIVLKSDGMVWAWGRNSEGQLGDGTTTYKTTPVQVSNLSGVTAVAGGDYHNLSLKSNGTVWTWGNNYSGQLGDGTTTDRTTPVQVTGLSGVSAISGGEGHTIALKSDGTVWAWGWNYYGQLGDGTTTDRYTPVQVSGLDLDETTTPTCEEATSISVSPDSLTLAAIESTLVTVTVTGEDNCAVEGETVTATIDATSENYIVLSPASQTTDANGQAIFTITALNNSGNAAVVFQAGSLTKTLTVSVITEEGIVFGFVIDEDDNPLKGVTVTITGNNSSDSTETDDDGYYEFGGLGAGEYAITYEKEGFLAQTQDISLEEGELKDLGTVTMEQVVSGEIYGYVVNIKSDPIEFVRLKLRGVKTKVTKNASTDADGFFEFADLEADTYVIIAKKKKYKNAQQKVTLEEGESTEIEIVMKKTTKRIKELLPGEDVQ